MSQTRLIIGLTVAIVVGLFIARYVYVQLRIAKETKPAAMAQVVVAATRVPLGDRLSASQLREVPWPAGQQPAGSFFHISDCVDRVVIGSVLEGEPILEGKLAPKESGAGLAAAIPEGMRAISVHVDDVMAVAGFVGPGSLVDVLATGTAMTGEIITKTILQGIRVLAVGQKVDQDREGKPQSYTVATLLVTPDDAAKLSMASTEGKIHLALRNSIDLKQTTTSPVSRSSLFLGAAPPAATSPKPRTVRPAAPKKAEVYLIEVIRGDKRENQSFPAVQAHP